MGTFYCNSIFVDARESGWSENWYMTAETYATVAAFMNYVSQARLSLLAAGNTLRENRISDVSIFRDSLVNAYSAADGAGRFGTAAPLTASEHANDRLLIRMEAGPQFRRSLEMGGIPEGISDSGGAYTPTATWSRLFNRWQGILTGSDPNAPAAGPIQLRQAFTVTPVSVQSLVATGSGNLILGVVCNTPDVAGYSVGQFVRLSRFKNTVFVQGKWKIGAVLAGSPSAGLTTLFMNIRRRPPVFSASSIMGRMSQYAGTLTYSNINNIIPERVVARRTGRPFDSPHGVRPTLR